MCTLMWPRHSFVQITYMQHFGRLSYTVMSYSTWCKGHDTTKNLGEDRSIKVRECRQVELIILPLVVVELVKVSPASVCQELNPSFLFPLDFFLCFCLSLLFVFTVFPPYQPISLQFPLLLQSVLLFKIQDCDTQKPRLYSR